MTELHAALGTTGVPLRLRRPPVLTRKPRWRTSMYAALTAALIIAVAMAGFFAIQQQSTTPSPTEVPEVVLGLAGQETASPAAAEVCGTSADIPIFSGINESPIDSPGIIVTSDGEMKLVCNGEASLLAKGVRMVTPSQAPHVIVAMTENGPLLMNIASGESLQIPVDLSPAQAQSISLSVWESWAILPSTDDSSLASVYNLETLTEIPITGADSRVSLNNPLTAAFSGDDTTVAFAVASTPDGEAQTLEGFFVAHSDGTSEFVKTAEPVDPRQMAISPDGTTIALTSYEGERNEGTTSLTLFDAAAGTVLNTWNVGDFDQFVDLAWLNDGSALLFTDGTALYQVTAPNSQREIVFEGEQVRGLTLTQDNRVVAVSHLEMPDAGMPQPKTTIINLDTGEETTLDGRDMWTGSTLNSRRSTLILTDSQAPMNGAPDSRGSMSSVQTGTPGSSADGTTVRRVAVNAVTGEVLGEINYTDFNPNGFAYSSWGNDRNIEVLAFSPDSMWRLVDATGNPTLEQIPSVPIETEQGQRPIMILRSPDGYLAVSTYEPATSWIMPPGEDEWIQVDLVTPEESIGVHPGIYFLPGSN